MKEILYKIAEELDFNLNDNWNSEINTINYNNDEMIYVGWIVKYEFLRGYGFIADLINNEKHFFHVSDVGEDLFTKQNSNNDDLTLHSLLDELRHNFYKNPDYIDYQKELQRKGLDNIEVSANCRFGSYKLNIEKYPKIPMIIDSNLSGFPCLYQGQIVCFTLDNGKVTNIHKPQFYKSKLICQKNNYNNDLWSLLFHFIPSVLYKIKYEGFEDINEEICKYREQILSKIQDVKQYDILPLTDINNYALNLEIDYHPTTRDGDDPNTLVLYCKPLIHVDEYISSCFSWRIQLTPTIDYYGEAPITYFSDIVFDEYKKSFDEYLEKRKGKTFAERNSLVEDCFNNIKKQRINHLVSDYSSYNHLLFYINKLKSQFVNRCILLVENVCPDFYSYDVKFEFKNDLDYYGNKIEFKFSNLQYTKPSYKVYTYDNSFKGRYKGKHFINEIQLEDNNDVNIIKNEILRTMNKELHDYLEAKFDLLVEEVMKKF